MQTLPTALPTANQLINNYIKALGGAAAIGKITSRVAQGTANSPANPSASKFSRKLRNTWNCVRHLPEGDSVVAFDGHAGWIGIPGRPVREMHGADIEAARLDADLQFPLHIQQMFPELRVEYPEKIGDREAYVLSPSAKASHRKALFRRANRAARPLGALHRLPAWPRSHAN